MYPLQGIFGMAAVILGIVVVILLILMPFAVMRIEKEVIKIRKLLEGRR